MRISPNHLLGFGLGALVALIATLLTEPPWTFVPFAVLAGVWVVLRRSYRAGRKHSPQG